MNSFPFTLGHHHLPSPTTSVCVNPVYIVPLKLTFPRRLICGVVLKLKLLKRSLLPIRFTHSQRPSIKDARSLSYGASHREKTNVNR